MAHFRGTITGNRGGASRCGTKRSGIVAKANGWHLGVRVMARYDDILGDIFEIYRTGGSSGSLPDKLIAKISRDFPFVDSGLQHQEHQQ